MSDLEVIHAQLVNVEASAHAARLTVERLIAQLAGTEQARVESEELTPERKVPPTFGDAASHNPQER
jgi:hypothetical protein